MPGLGIEGKMAGIVSYTILNRYADNIDRIDQISSLKWISTSVLGHTCSKDAVLPT